MRIGHRVENRTNSELEEELKTNQLQIESLVDTNRIIENELFYRKS